MKPFYLSSLLNTFPTTRPLQSSSAYIRAVGTLLRTASDKGFQFTTPQICKSLPNHMKLAPPSWSFVPIYNDSTIHNLTMFVHKALRICSFLTRHTCCRCTRTADNRPHNCNTHVEYMHLQSRLQRFGYRRRRRGCGRYCYNKNNNYFQLFWLSDYLRPLWTEHQKYCKSNVYRTQWSISILRFMNFCYALLPSQWLYSLHKICYNLWLYNN